MLAMVTSMLLAPATLGAGPWIEVVSPDAGGWVTDPALPVSGNATPLVFTTEVDASLLGTGSGFGMEWDGENLTMSPRQLFADGFSGNTLDTDKWTIVRNVGVVEVADGYLKLANVDYNQNYPLVQSNDGLFPKQMDWTARYHLRMTSQGYSGSGGGLSTTGADPYTSHMSVWNLYAWQEPWFQVYVDGESVYNASRTETSAHLYTLQYENQRSRFTALMDGDQVGQFNSGNTPSHFWFGAQTNGVYGWYANIDVDYVDVWAFNGKRTLDPVQLDRRSAIDRVRLDWTSNRRQDATVAVDVRVSDDNVTWSPWVPVTDGVPSEELEGSWLQVRVDASLRNVRDVNARIQMTGLQVDRHYPLTDVWVRNTSGDGRWVNATGLEQWTARVDLVEDLNTIEVRAQDTSGAVNVTSFLQTLDTTPPVGSIEILKDRPYTNDLNVTLSLNASDKYGVGSMQVSNSADFHGARTFPFATELEWRMLGYDGEITCYVRFIDNHGLVGEAVRDSIIYDSLPPTCELTIRGGAQYTPTLEVDLTFAHADLHPVTLIELSNRADFVEVETVDPNATGFTGWMLEEGDDGPRTVHLRLTDVAGNTMVVNETIVYYGPKALGSLVLEEGANVTGSTIVSVLVDIPWELRPNLMQLANEPTFERSTWEAVEQETLWILFTGDGPKTVYLRFQDFRQIASLPVNASILLDTTPPKVTMGIDDGATHTIDQWVNVSLEYDDMTAATAMWVAREDQWRGVEGQDFAEAFQWMVPAREGPQEVFVKIADLAGNEVVVSSSIHFATVVPTLEVSLPDGHVQHGYQGVALGLEWTDPYGEVEVRISLDAAPLEDVGWTPAAEVMSLELPDGVLEGEHTIFVQARNLAGLLSEPFTVDLILDRSPPVVTITYPLNGTPLPQAGFDLLLEVEAHDANGIVEAQYQLDDGDWHVIKGANLSAVMTLDVFGDHTVVVRVHDVAGNVGTDTSTFRVEDVDARVGQGGSSMLLIILIMVAILVGAGYEVHRRRKGGTGLSFLGHHTEHPTPYSEVIEASTLAPEGVAPAEGPDLEPVSPPETEYDGGWFETPEE